MRSTYQKIISIVFLFSLALWLIFWRYHESFKSGGMVLYYLFILCLIILTVLYIILAVWDLGDILDDNYNYYFEGS